MRVVPFDGEDNLEDIASLSIMIKAVPFENDFAPAFVLISPSEDYEITIEEVNCLMDGLEIARIRVDNLIDFMLRIDMDHDQSIYKLELDQKDEDDDENNGKSD